MATMFDPTEEQLKNRELAVAGLPTITSNSLKDNSGDDYQSYNDKTVDVSNLKVEMTPTQTQAQTETDDLRSLMDSLTGESEMRTQLKQEKDIAGLTKLTNEQAIIVQNLQSEAQRLANEYAGVEDVMQKQAAGRGITAGGLAPLTAGERRNIAIDQRSIASQALTAYAAYNTAAGNLQLAQSAIDDAVSAKYDPIREKIDIKKQNLELLLNSPRATAEEKALAKAELKKQEAEDKKVDEQENFFKSIQEVYIAAASTQGVNPVLINNIKKILNKEDLTVDDVAEVNRLAAEAGLFAEKVDYLSVAEAKSLGVPYGTTRQDAMNRGLIPGNGDNGGIDIPNFDDFVDEFMQTEQGQESIRLIEEQRRQTLTPEARKRALEEELRDLYNQTVSELTPKEEFTATEKKKLEQAGLLNASRQEQLDYLYGKTGSGGDINFDEI